MSRHVSFSSLVLFLGSKLGIVAQPLHQLAAMWFHQAVSSFSLFPYFRSFRVALRALCFLLHPNLWWSSSFCAQMEFPLVLTGYHLLPWGQIAVSVQCYVCYGLIAHEPCSCHAPSASGPLHMPSHCMGCPSSISLPLSLLKPAWVPFSVKISLTSSLNITKPVSNLIFSPSSFAILNHFLVASHGIKSAQLHWSSRNRRTSRCTYLYPSPLAHTHGVCANCTCLKPLYLLFYWTAGTSHGGHKHSCSSPTLYHPIRIIAPSFCALEVWF